MKKLFKVFIPLFLIASFSIATANCGTCTTGCYDPCNSCYDCGDCCYDCDSCLRPCDGYPYLAYRSQGVNAARELAGWQEFINLTDICDHYAAFYAAFEYTKTFKPERITQFYFGNSLVGCNSLLIQGTEVDNRNGRAWIADYFGLPKDFESCVTFCPQIENFIVDLSYFHGLDKWREGAYIRISAPIVHTRWNLCMNESVKAEGTADFQACYMSDDIVPRKDLPKSFCEVMNGCVTFGNMQEPLCYGKMSRCRLTETRLADIHLALGYNFARKCDGHFGAHLYLGIPTGNRPCAKYLFEPIVGNGKHWELGLGLTSSWVFWRDECEEDIYMGVYWDANLTHLFKSCQCRSFDYCGCPNGRYGLLSKMGPNATDDTQLKYADVPVNPTTFEPTTYQYQGALVPAINRTTFKVDVKVPFQFDWAVKLAYYRCNWSLDVGYNLWARTGEKFCKCTDCCNDCCNDCCCGPCGTTCGRGVCGMYAKKGDALIYGFKDSTTYCDEPIALSCSQNCSCINTAGNLALFNKGEAVKANTNYGIDNPFRAAAEDNTLLGPCDPPGDTIFTSEKTIFATNLNMCKSPGAITHKIFANINYTWEDACGCNDKWTPFLGLGFEAEFAPCKDCCDDCCFDSCNTYCDPCGMSCNPCNTSYCDPCGTSCYNTCCDDGCSKKRAGINQWGVWIKGGVAYE